MKENVRVHQRLKLCLIIHAYTTFILCVEVISIQSMTFTSLIHCKHLGNVAFDLFGPRPLAGTCIAPNHWAWALVLHIGSGGYGIAISICVISGSLEHILGSDVVFAWVRWWARAVLFIIHIGTGIAGVGRLLDVSYIIRDNIVIVEAHSCVGCIIVVSPARRAVSPIE
jgi:hypothetical protein